MSPDATIETFFDEDGGLWAVFVYGHCLTDLVAEGSLRQRFVGELEAHLDEADARDLMRNAVVQFWIVDTTPEYEGEPEEIECPWQFCEARTPGAIAVTGVKFQ